MNWILKLILCALAPMCATTAVAQSSTATIVYQDGSKATLSDWAFQYQFGEADEIARNQVGYVPVTKVSTGLIIEGRVLDRTDIRTIDLFWGESTGWSLKRTEIRLWDGTLLKNSLLMPKSSLLSTKKYVFQQKVSILANDGLAYPLNFMTVSSLDNPSSRITRIEFQH